MVSSTIAHRYRGTGKSRQPPYLSFQAGVRAVVIAVVSVLIGCGTSSVDDYQARSPAFSPNDFFYGALTAHGVVKDFSGTVIRHFQANITGCWENGIGTLDEDFTFDDGEQQTRVWTLTPDGDQTYSGRRRGRGACQVAGKRHVPRLHTAHRARGWTNRRQD